VSSWRRHWPCCSRRTCWWHDRPEAHLHRVQRRIPAEFTAIKAGQIDATVSQPADLYAKYALFYAQAALSGKSFMPARPTTSPPSSPSPTVWKTSCRPAVTKDNVDDASLWGNQVGK